MAVTFPNEFPALELKQLVKFISKQDTDHAKVALAAYGILGYAGYQVYGQPTLQLANQGTIAAGGLAANAAPKVEDVVIPREISDKEIVETVQRLNDVINDGKLKGASAGVQDIPKWVFDILFQILETFLNRIKGVQV